jgi:cytochrome c-type biogenesis protein
MATPSLSVGLALVAGMITPLSPCILPILPIILGRSLQSHRYGPLVLITGLVSGFAIAGSLLGITASWLTGLINGLRLIAIALLFVLGLFAIFPKWSYVILSYLPVGRWAKPPQRSDWVGEFWLGTQLGLLWTPCAGPILGGILVLAAVNHEVAGAFGLLLVYGLGAGLPLLAIAYGGRSLSQRLLSIRTHSALLQRVGGVMVVGTAIAILMGWDVQLQLWVAPLFPRLPL